MKRKNLKMTSLFLIFSILLACVSSIPIVADTTETVFDGANSPPDADTWESVGDTVIGAVVEVEELRDERVKHFTLPDGTYKAVSYVEPVHRMDANGVWQDIDNSLTLQSNAAAQKYSTSDGRVTFAQRYNKDEPLVSLSENGYSISMSYLAPAISEGTTITTTPMEPAQVENAPLRADSFNSFEEAARVDNRSAVKYNNIRSNTDLEYVLIGNDVKENIIVRSRADSYSYTFRLDLGGLIARLEENGEITIRDDENETVKYVMPAPYMYDANGEVSYEASYDLLSVKTGVYLLTVTADTEWMNSSDRAYPITIDPTITYTNGVIDSYVSSYSPNQNYGTIEELWIGNSYNTYIKVDLPQLPSGSIINSACLCFDYHYNISTGSLSAGMYQILESWSESSITYNNAPACSNICLDTVDLFAASNISKTNPGEALAIITEAAKSWYSGETNNYGIMLKRESGSNLSVIIESSERAGHSPFIVVGYIYNIPDGVYSISLATDSTRFMKMNSNGILGQQVYTSNPASTDVFAREALFKISYIGSDKYIIRLMTDNKKTFGLSNGSWVSRYISSDDDKISAMQDVFSIQWSENGYLISQYMTSNTLNMQSTSTFALNSVDTTNATDNAKWVFTKYTGVHRNGVTYLASPGWNSVGLVTDTTYSVNYSAWTTNINGNAVLMTVRDEYMHLGDVSQGEDTHTMIYTPYYPGTMKFRFILTSEVGDSTSTINTGTTTRHIIPKVGIYNIQNVDTEGYIDVEGASMVEGGVIQQWSYHTGNQAKWQVEHVAGTVGYIRLKSVKSGLYMGVDPSNTNLIKQYDDQNDYTLWKVEQSDRGCLKFVCKETESSGKVLSVPSATSGNGADLTQETYTTYDTCSGEWFMVTKVISFVNYYDTSISTKSNVNDLLDYIVQANKFVNSQMSKYYGIGFRIKVVPTFRNDFCIDGCNNSSCINCTGSCRGDHHKNIYNIADELYAENTENDQIIVLWSDRPQSEYCVGKGETHISLDSESENNAKKLAIVCNYNPVIHILSSHGSSSLRDRSYCYILLHEVTHTFRMEDIYDDPTHIKNINENNNKDFNCCMNPHSPVMLATFMNEVENGTMPFCQDCHRKIHNLTRNITLIGSQE